MFPCGKGGKCPSVFVGVEGKVNPARPKRGKNVDWWGKKPSVEEGDCPSQGR